MNKRRKILVADRDRDVCEGVKEYLSDSYDVLVVDDGREIMPVMLEHEIDLLLTNIDLPNVYIYTLLNKIKEYHPELPIIIMYVYFDSTQEMENTIRKMSDAMVLKPFNLDALKMRIDALVEKAAKVM